MMYKRNVFIGMIAVLAMISVELQAQDWPQLFGPERNHTSSQKGLLRSWPESGPEVLWSVNVGRGYGGPVVKDGKVYLLDRDDEAGDMIRCFDLQTGNEQWKFSYDSPGEIPFPGSRSVPIVDSKHIYSVGQHGELYCIDLQTHRPVWNKNIWTDFGDAALPVWGISQCPLIYGDLLIVAPQAPQAGAVAYNKTTGAIVWQTPNLTEPRMKDNYSSPKMATVHGEEHLVVVSASLNLVQNRGADPVPGKVTGINPRTGEILWQITGWECHITVPSAVDAGNNRLLITGGYELGAMMIEVNKKPDGTFEAVELFRTTEFGDQTKPPLLHNGYFYAMYRTNAKNEGLICMDMDGNVMWKTGRNPNFDRGSMILADGLLLATDGMSTLYLIEPDPTAFKPVSKATVLREGGVPTEGMSVMGGRTQNWAPMALADGKLLIRDQNRMLCVKVTK
ncbi:MAG: PQQ-like beta-propeller repeat protein [Tannerella sp.]|jgi:outer membrane protein assembly factor BamB|nr:PQQ-like beta-propeller repeat protein [Tannerella sp.]